MKSIGQLSSKYVVFYIYMTCDRSLVYTLQYLASDNIGLLLSTFTLAIIYCSDCDNFILIIWIY